MSRQMEARMPLAMFSETMSIRVLLCLGCVGEQQIAIAVDRHCLAGIQYRNGSAFLDKCGPGDGMALQKIRARINRGINPAICKPDGPARRRSHLHLSRGDLRKAEP